MKSKSLYFERDDQNLMKISEVYGREFKFVEEIRLECAGFVRCGK